MTEMNSTFPVAASLLETISADRLYDLLSHHYRRFVLAALVRRDEPTTLATLAYELADQEDDTGETAEVDSQSAIKTRLYHVHVPKLAEAGLIEFDPAINTVSPPEDDPTPQAVAPLLPELHG